MTEARSPRRRRAWARSAALALAACAVAGADVAPARAAPAERLETLRVRTLENLALQVPFLRLRARNTLAPLVGRVELSGVRNPDEIRAALTSGSADVITLPTNVAATLANRGIDVRLLGVVQASLLRIVGPPGARFDWRELRGQPVAIPFRGDAPDLIFRSLAGRNGLDPDRDVTITNYPQIPEVVSALVSGRARYAVLPEPQATLAVTQGAAAGLALGPRLSLTGAWRRATGDTLPQAGVAVRGEIARRYPAVVAALQRELDATTRAYSADPIAAGRRLAPLTGLPEQGAATIVARLRPDYVPARTVQRQVERYFQVLARATPDAIGGRLPDRSFYVPPAR